MSYETRRKTGKTSAIVRAVRSRRNYSQQTHPILHIGPYTDVLVRFIPFGCIRDCLVALLGGKRAELVQKFVPRSRVGFFRNERT